MNGLARIAAQLLMVGMRAWGRKWSFSGLFLLVFAFMTLSLAQLDLLPDPASVEASPAAAGLVSDIPTPTAEPVLAMLPEEPVKIEAKAIGLSAVIANPATTNVDALDALLLKGAVRYPTSAKLGEEGNVVLFGHSSYLPIVRNPAYKTFDGIQKLKEGDVVTVYSSGTAYIYAVKSVVKEKASEGAIPLSVSGKVLTLATCNSFATKDDRFVITADFVESHPLAS